MLYSAYWDKIKNVLNLIRSNKIIRIIKRNIHVCDVIHDNYMFSRTKTRDKITANTKIRIQ